MTDEQATDTNGLTRRQALAAAAALCGFGTVAAAGTGTAQASGTLRVRLADHPELAKVGGIARVGAVGSRPVAVVRTSTRTYIALSLICPHVGEEVTPRGSGFVCLPPGHGSTFASNGARRAGPASTGLRRLRVRPRAGTLIISA